MADDPARPVARNLDAEMEALLGDSPAIQDRLAQQAAANVAVSPGNAGLTPSRSQQALVMRGATPATSQQAGMRGAILAAPAPPGLASVGPQTVVHDPSVTLGRPTALGPVPLAPPPAGNNGSPPQASPRVTDQVRAIEWRLQDQQGRTLSGRHTVATRAHAPRPSGRRSPSVRDVPLPTARAERGSRSPSLRGPRYPMTPTQASAA